MGFMKDKEKQIKINREAGAMADLLNQEQEELQKASAIEEMAKIMCGNDCEECAKESAEFYKQTIEEARNNKCLLKNCAKTLYEQGYRKLPEDSVVLSKEEYESDLTAQYDVGYEFGRKETEERDFNTATEQLKQFAEKVKQAICDNTYPYFDKNGKPVNIWNTDGFDRIDELLKEYEK